MSKKPSRQRHTSGSKKASRSECPPAAATDVEPDGAGHSNDRDSDKASRSSGSILAAQHVVKPPRLRRRRSSTVPVPPGPNELNDPSSVPRHRGGVRRHQRKSEPASPHSPGNREPITAPFAGSTAADATGRLPEQPGETRRNSAVPSTYSRTPSQASSVSRTVKEEPAESTAELARTVDVPSTPGGEQRSGDPGRGAPDEYLLQAPDNRDSVAVTSDVAPSASTGPASTARIPARTPASQPRRSTFTRATLRFASGRGKSGSGAGTLTEQHPRLEDLLQVSPKKEKPGGAGPWFDQVTFVGAAALLAVILALALFALYPRHKADGREVVLCGTADCIEHAGALGIDPVPGTLPCECFGCFVCSGWSNEYRHISGTVKEQVTLHWIGAIDKLSLGDYDGQLVRNRPLTMMRRCMTTTDDEENAVRMMTAFVSERSFAWPTPGEPERIIDYGRALEVVMELSAVWAVPLWFRVQLLPAVPSVRLQRDRAVLLSPSTPSLLWRFTHDTISRYQDGYSIYTSFYESLFAVRPLSESFATFLRTRSGDVQGHILRKLAAAIDGRLPQPRLMEIGSMPKFVRNLSANDWVRALRSVYGTRAPEISANDLIMAVNGRLINAIDSIFASNTAQDIFFHTIWWFVQSVGSTITSKLRLSVKNLPEGVYFQRLICFDHVDTTYNVLLAAINKEMLSAQERVAISSRLDHIRSVVVEKLRAYSKLNAEAKRTLSAVVENMSTVIWAMDDFGRPGGFEQYFGPPYNGSEGGFYAEWQWSRLQAYNRDAKMSVESHDYVAAAEVFSLVEQALTAYNPVLNVLSLSVAALRPPLYYGEGTSAMFYGGVGFVYAEGIFKAIDMLAHLFDGRSVMAPSESESTRSFWNASWCADVRDAEVAFPSLLALDVAYTTYLRFRNESSDLRLKGLREYTPAQVFFATFCHGTCWTDNIKRKFSEQCTEGAKNYGPFAEVFSCPAQAKAKKCSYV
ncbi:hypothetical protein HPB50_026886 [Hyalomma asiaticum]|uniref:Uncharacterized protein n=1 Tax=Hyalomma asiaticum TaxID=266040 RepID=A0ACB7RZ63_HYAAI|nr:hypothetical protein HPB50_026886 [Hyalomma asiaticum]